MKLFSKKSFKDSSNDYGLLLIRIFLAIVFIFSGVTKLLALQGFVQIVNHFMILPETIVPYFADLLPVVELFLGLCLLSGLYNSISNNTDLQFYHCNHTILSLIRGLSVNCGCFARAVWWCNWMENFNAEFSFLGLASLLIYQKKVKICNYNQ